MLAQIGRIPTTQVVQTLGINQKQCIREKKTRIQLLNEKRAMIYEQYSAQRLGLKIDSTRNIVTKAKPDINNNNEELDRIIKTYTRPDTPVENRVGPSLTLETLED
jgi:hypothetical protein